MSHRFISRFLLAGLTGVLLCATALAAQGGDLKIEIQLIWGTNDAKSPDPKHKPAEREVERKLKEQPLKWKNYFEVNRKNLSLPDGAERKETLSGECAIQVKNLGKEEVEVTLIGKGKETGKVRQRLPKGELLVIGGNARNETSWFVVLKQME